MKSPIEELIRNTVDEWATPQSKIYADQIDNVPNVMVFCRSEDNSEDFARSADLPNDLNDFWDSFLSADLFIESRYQQGGLKLLSVAESNEATRDFVQNRSTDFQQGDRIIGAFLGDLDCLIARCDSGSKDFGSVIVAIPDGFRHEWFIVGDSLTAFLRQFIANDGRKYWEQ